jgi:hypothetical protein
MPGVDCMHMIFLGVQSRQGRQSRCLVNRVGAGLHAQMASSHFSAILQSDTAWLLTPSASCRWAAASSRRVTNENPADADDVEHKGAAVRLDITGYIPIDDVRKGCRPVLPQGQVLLARRQSHLRAGRDGAMPVGGRGAGAPLLFWDGGSRRSLPEPSAGGHHHHPGYLQPSYHIIMFETRCRMSPRRGKCLSRVVANVFVGLFPRLCVRGRGPVGFLRDC